MKIFNVFMFVLLTNLVFGQDHADYYIYQKGDRVMMDMIIQLDGTEQVIQNDAHCNEDMALSFCIRNYIQDKMSVSIDDEEIQWVIESSTSNNKIHFTSFSSESTYELGELTVENKAFIDVFPMFKNNIEINQNKEQTYEFNAQVTKQTFLME